MLDFDFSICEFSPSCVPDEVLELCTSVDHVYTLACIGQYIVACHYFGGFIFSIMFCFFDWIYLSGNSPCARDECGLNCLAFGVVPLLGGLLWDLLVTQISDVQMY